MAKWSDALNSQPSYRFLCTVLAEICLCLAVGCFPEAVEGHYYYIVKSSLATSLWHSQSTPMEPWQIRRRFWLAKRVTNEPKRRRMGGP